MKKILIALLTVLCLQTLVFAMTGGDDLYLRQSQYDTNYDKMRRFAIGINFLNVELIKGYAGAQHPLTKPSDYFHMLSRSEDVDSSKTTKNSFTTKNGITYTMIPLKSTCEAAPEDDLVGAQTACAQIIISYRNANDKFQVYLYENVVKKAPNSKEDKLFDSRTWF